MALILHISSAFSLSLTARCAKVGPPTKRDPAKSHSYGPPHRPCGETFFVAEFDDQLSLPFASIHALATRSVCLCGTLPRVELPGPGRALIWLAWLQQPFAEIRVADRDG